MVMYELVSDDSNGYRIHLLVDTGTGLTIERFVSYDKAQEALYLMNHEE